MSSFYCECLKDYARTIEDSRPGVEGRRKTAKVIAHALYAMNLTIEEAIEVINEWNASLAWMWPQRDINNFIGWVRDRHDPFYF